MNRSDSESLLDGIDTLEDVMYEFVDTADESDVVAVRHAIEALNGLHHARQAVVAIRDPEHLDDRDRREVRERA